MPHEAFNEEFWSELDSLGEEKVLVRLRVSKQWGDSPLGNKHALVLIWLKRQEDARAADSSTKRASRAARTLAIAEEALSIARDDLSIARSSAKSARANARWAMYAAIIAIVAAAISAKDQIIALIFGTP